MTFIVLAIVFFGKPSAAVHADQGYINNKILVDQWNDLTAQVQKNGLVNVMVRLNSPAWDQISYSTLKSQHTKADALRIYGYTQLNI